LPILHPVETMITIFTREAIDTAHRRSEFRGRPGFTEQLLAGSRPVRTSPDSPRPWRTAQRRRSTACSRITFLPPDDVRLPRGVADSQGHPVQGRPGAPEGGGAEEHKHPASEGSHEASPVRQVCGDGYPVGLSPPRGAPRLSKGERGGWGPPVARQHFWRTPVGVRAFRASQCREGLPLPR